MNDTQNNASPKPYRPDPLPPTALDWDACIALMGKANRSIANYNGLLQSIVNPDVLLSPLRTQEAVLSSKIEGTQATLEEVMEFDAEQKKGNDKKEDIEEVVNYRKALLAGREAMEKKPLSLNVIRELHKILLSGVRGQRRDPGNFRRIQNWIGPLGRQIEQARYVPPSVPDMKEALHEWEKYLHKEEKDVMVQLAIVHAQFEIIHPFMDGNGRIGRILIPLFLYHKEIIYQPVFYMSQYLESNRPEYYDALKEITDTGDWTNWVQFFLKGIIQQAKKNSEQTKAILDLYEKMKQKISELTHSQYSIQCLDFIFSTPIFTTSNFQEESNVPKASASRLIRALEEESIIDCIERGAGRRPSKYIFKQLLKIINQ